MSIKYHYRHGGRIVQKEVVLFLAKTHTKQVMLSHEHIGFAWKNYRDALKQVTYHNAKNLLSAAKDFLKQHSLAYG
jgi:hypothetical protein